MLATLRPDLRINPEEVLYIKQSTERLPGKKETLELVAIVFKYKNTLYVDLDIDYVTAVLNNECAYKEKWIDEVGNIPICILHDNNSRYEESEGPHRPCLTVAPYPPPLQHEVNPVYIYQEPQKGPIARFFSRGG